MILTLVLLNPRSAGSSRNSTSKNQQICFRIVFDQSFYNLFSQIFFKEFSPLLIKLHWLVAVGNTPGSPLALEKQSVASIIRILAQVYFCEESNLGAPNWTKTHGAILSPLLKNYSDGRNDCMIWSLGNS